jgi:hypothetical protein
MRFLGKAIGLLWRPWVGIRLAKSVVTGDTARDDGKADGYQGVIKAIAAG